MIMIPEGDFLVCVQIVQYTLMTLKDKGACTRGSHYVDWERGSRYVLWICKLFKYTDTRPLWMRRSTDSDDTCLYKVAWR